jgi:transposase InsO family protein
MTAALTAPLGQSPASKVRAVVPEQYMELASMKFAAVQWRRDVIRSKRDAPLGVKDRGSLDEYIGSQQQPPVDGHTIRRWDREFTTGGLSGLAPKVRSDQGHSRIFAKHPEVADFVQAKCLSEGIRNAKHIHEIVRTQYPKLSLSYDTVRLYIEKEIPLPLKTYAHEGPQALLAKRLPFVQRKRPAPMEWWIADHRVFDVRMRNTMFPAMRNEKAFRLWITAIYDWGSDHLVGFCFSHNPSSVTINSALRMALRNFGFPKHFYWDNGLDFGAVRERLEEIQIAQSVQALLAANQIQFGVTQALPFRPRSKPIEALFTRWSKRFDPLWRSAYVGNRASNRPEASAIADRQHAQFLKGKRKDSPLPTDRTFVTAADQWIHEYNTAARLEGLNGRTPAEVMDEAFPPEARAEKRPPARLLDSLLMKDDERTILQGGCVEICRMRYEPKPESLGELFLLQGKRVRILRDPYDFSEAIAVDPKTMHFIGELALQIPLEQLPNGRRGDENYDELQAALRTQRAIHRACRNALEAIGCGASMNGWHTEVEGLLERSAARLKATGTNGRELPASAPGARSARALLAAPAFPQSSEEFIESGAMKRES